MDKKISIDYSYTLPFITEYMINGYKDSVLKAAKTLADGTGEGNDFIGWRQLPTERLNSEELNKIVEVSNEIYENADLLICVGIGGSYLGAKAVTEALCHPFYNMLSDEDRKGPKLLFAGQNISASWMNAILDQIDKCKSVYVNVISKSGTTTEPGIAFRNIKTKMEKKYGKIDASKRIIATTDAKKGALRTLATNEGYRTFIIPDDVGGRFSVLTPVGLLPIGAVGIDIMKLLQGAQEASRFGAEQDLALNPAFTYACIRNLLLQKGYHTEILVNYEPTLHYFSEWWKQLYGESEGKGRKGIFPASCQITADLHSLGQFIQDGEPIIQESMVRFEEPAAKLEVKATEANEDGLNYVAGKDMNQVLLAAQKGTMEAHIAGGVPVMEIVLDRPDEATFGEMVLFYEIACGISCYMQKVNPFNQPGVEDYKKNMFRLLGKK